MNPVQCNIYATVRVTSLVCTWQHFEKYHFENSIKNQPCSGSLSIIMLSCLLAFAQLTWQVAIDNDWFSTVLIFSWNSLVLGQCLYGVGGRGMGWGGWVVAKAKTKKQDDTIGEFRVAMTCSTCMTCTCTHKGPIFHHNA